MATIGLYFRFPQTEANRLRARLNEMALSLGYAATRGPTAGQGNLSAMLIALAEGELKIVSLTAAPCGEERRCSRSS